MALVRCRDCDRTELVALVGAPAMPDAPIVLWDLCEKCRGEDVNPSDLTRYAVPPRGYFRD